MISTPIPITNTGNPASEPEAEAEAESTLPSVKIADAIPLTVHLPVDARGVALGILATVALIFALDWAQPFLITLLLGILFAYTLNPLVVWLERIKIPRVVGASVVMVAAICALAFGAYALRGQVQEILAQLPDAASKLSTGLDKMRRGSLSTMKDVQAAASTIEKATNQADQSAIPKQRATHVVIDQPTFKLSNFLWVGSRGVFAFIGQATMVFFLVYFFLLGGDMFKRKLVRLAGPTLSKRKITVHILDDINDSIQQYMFMLLVTNVLVGLLTWIALHWIGLENAGAWAVAAGLVHVIPYAGPALTAIILGMAAFMQFDSFSMGLLAAGASLAIATFVGTLVTTWMTGKFAKMNTAAVFVSLLFWAWLWGVWGMLLGIPIIVIVKVVSQHVEQLHPVAELLGE
ncbi:MAG: AI-2E family transporter [Gallionellales bacterium RBG_16_56_9]|nr:MAG: AI-2E family transporter [Betaproteobacteria bacterium RBG_19FT_COMBO_58_11]OGS96961.1 MAG: AI-2E family transporter [Gallionellales bacterium RBG_16_56_9]